jgi:vibriolysin
MALQVQVFVATSGVAPHPSVQIDIPTDYKIIGGGAFDHWGEPGNLLTAAYPKGLHTWFAAGKDHEDPSPASITGFAIAIHDPNNEWDVIIKSETSNPAPHPQAVAILPSGYKLTGGGAFVDWTGAGNLLTASFPNSESSWEARSKDHDISDPSRITAYAIGMKHKGTLTLKTIIKSATGPKEPHPKAQVCLDTGWILSGGGALDDWSGAGNLLTASYPQGLCWLAAGKDHKVPSPASITAYAIGIRV